MLSFQCFSAFGFRTRWARIPTAPILKSTTQTAGSSCPARGQRSRSRSVGKGAACGSCSAAASTRSNRRATGDQGAASRSRRRGWTRLARSRRGNSATGTTRQSKQSCARQARLPGSPVSISTLRCDRWPGPISRCATRALSAWASGLPGRSGPTFGSWGTPRSSRSGTRTIRLPSAPSGARTCTAGISPPSLVARNSARCARAGMTWHQPAGRGSSGQPDWT